MQAKTHVRAEARLLRSQGRSIREIAEMVGASKGSVSVWVRDVELSPELKQMLERRDPFKNKEVRGPGGAEGNRQKYMILRKQYQDEGREKAKENDPLHVKGCMLYWAEGTKNRNSVKFCNSDPEMMRLFMRFLRAYFDISNVTVSFTVDCYINNSLSLEDIEAFWLELLELPKDSVRKHKPDERSRSGKKTNKFDYGVCGVCINSTKIVQHIFGAIQEYVGVDEYAYKWIE